MGTLVKKKALTGRINGDENKMQDRDVDQDRQGGKEHAILIISDIPPG
jgi:hypothetical protein